MSTFVRGKCLDNSQNNLNVIIARILAKRLIRVFSLRVQLDLVYALSLYMIFRTGLERQQRLASSQFINLIVLPAADIMLNENSCLLKTILR